jgi:hypothetical protein
MQLPPSPTHAPSALAQLLHPASLPPHPTLRPALRAASSESAQRRTARQMTRRKGASNPECNDQHSRTDRTTRERTNRQTGTCASRIAPSLTDEPCTPHATCTRTSLSTTHCPRIHAWSQQPTDATRRAILPCLMMRQRQCVVVVVVVVSDVPRLGCCHPLRDEIDGT